MGRFLDLRDIQQDLRGLHVLGRTLEIDDRRLRLTLSEVRDAQVVESGRLAGVHLEGFPEGAHGLVGAARQQEGRSTVDPTVRVLGVHADCLVVRFGGGFVATSFQQERPEAPP